MQTHNEWHATPSGPLHFDNTTVPTLPRSLAACATHEALHLRSTSDVESEFTKYLIKNHEYLAQRATAVQVQATGPACSRVLPVCQHSSVRYPLGSPTSAINPTVPAAAVEVDYVLLIRTQPKNMNHFA